MQIEVKQGELQTAADEAILLYCFEDGKRLAGSLKELDGILSGAISRLFENGDFAGKAGQVALVYPRQGLSFNRVLLVGLGKRGDLDAERIRRAFGSAGRRIKELKLRSLTVQWFESNVAGISLQASSQAMVEGMLLSQYRMDRYKTDKQAKTPALERLILLKESRKGLGEVKKGIQNGAIFAQATGRARDLGNMPGNDLTPTRLAAEAKKLADEFKLKCTILSEPEIRKLKMNAFLAVAAGSNQPPKLILLEYSPGRKPINTLALVGKGITFDSGGLSLKPTDLMLEMKGDMMGGAVVISAVAACAMLKLPVRVMGIVPATENLPSGKALKVGDIITSHSGKTIEVLNTDAEGRLILADALSYARTFNPDAVVDVATLTGSIKIALGTICAGLFGNSRTLIARMIQAGEESGERVWEMPMWEEYAELLKSDLADMKNVGGRNGGSILAAKFLQTFVGDLPWVHLDIAAVDAKDKEESYFSKGATGFGVRLLLQFLKDWKRI
jgi:leucyl aminopeptidase